jgi:hypothetical protein
MFLEVENAIAARLTEKLGALVKYVYTAAELAEVEEESQKTPAVLVSYNGYQPIVPNGGSQGKIQLMEKSWLVVPHVRSARETRTQQGARDEASPIISVVLEALCGWRPLVDGEMPLLLASAPGAAFTDAGFAYYPIAFTNRRTIRGKD